MEHSLQAYLEKLTTPELEGALWYCLQQEHRQDYTPVANMILQILENRNTISSDQNA